MGSSLNNVMNEIARAEKIIPSPNYINETTQELSELEAFAILDETLNDLQKQYLSAKAQRKSLIVASNTDDPMVPIAIDMEDSLWCAMQARYIELRQKRCLMQRVQKMMRQHQQSLENMKEQAVKRQEKKKTQDFINFCELMRTLKEKQKSSQILEFLMMFFFLQFDFIMGLSLKRQFNP